MNLKMGTSRYTLIHIYHHNQQKSACYQFCPGSQKNGFNLANYCSNSKKSATGNKLNT